MASHKSFLRPQEIHLGSPINRRPQKNSWDIIIQQIWPKNPNFYFRSNKLNQIYFIILCSYWKAFFKDRFMLCGTSISLISERIKCTYTFLEDFIDLHSIKLFNTQVHLTIVFIFEDFYQNIHNFLIYGLVMGHLRLMQP